MSKKSYELWKSTAVHGYVGRRLRFRAKWKSTIDTVLARTNMTMRQRVLLAGQMVRDKVVIQLSLPVRKFTREKTGSYFDLAGNKTYYRRTVTVVDEESRSKPGQFPRADTTRLMKDVRSWSGSSQDGLSYFIGTTLDYGLILETKLDRSFLRRTLSELDSEVRQILTGTTDAEGE